MAKSPKNAKAARTINPYGITAVQVRQTVGGELVRPETAEWDLMNREARTAWLLDAIQSYQSNRMSQGHETVLIWGPQIQFNAQYFLDGIAAIELAGFYVRTANNVPNLGDTIEISAVPFAV